MLTALKVCFKGEIHRIRVDLSEFEFINLQNLFMSTFNLPSQSFIIQYKDNEGDILNVTTTKEYLEAIEVFTTYIKSNEANQNLSIKFFAITNTQALFEEKIADPLVNAIEKLILKLNEAMEKVKNDEFTQRCSMKLESAVTRIKEDEFTQKCQKGMETTGEVVSQAVRDTISSLNEIPFDKVMKDASEGIKTAASEISTRTCDFVQDMKKKSEVNKEDDNVSEVVSEETATEEVEEPKSDEGEWEDVPSAIPAETEVVDAVAVAAPVVVDAEFEPPTPLEAAPAIETPPPAPQVSVWATELKMISEIFPNAAEKDVISLLENSKGNIQFVLNSLAESS